MTCINYIKDIRILYQIHERKRTAEKVTRGRVYSLVIYGTVVTITLLAERRRKLTSYRRITALSHLIPTRVKTTRNKFDNL